MKKSKNFNKNLFAIAVCICLVITTHAQQRKQKTVKTQETPQESVRKENLLQQENSTKKNQNTIKKESPSPKRFSDNGSFILFRTKREVGI